MAKKAAKKIAPVKVAAKKVAAKKVAKTHAVEDDLIGDTPTQIPAPTPPTLTKWATKSPPLPTLSKRVLTADDPDARIVKGVVIPPCPCELTTIQAGEKAPAAKKWYRENYPEAYVALFGSEE